MKCSCAIVSAEEIARPALVEEPPAPGKFVRVTAPEYAGTAVHHGLYLPRDWRRETKYPVIVEYAPNQAPAFGTTGAVADCRLGYYLSGGEGCIWVVMPYVNTAEKQNQPTWWGDESATIDYCRKNLARVCDAYGGDRDSVVLVGFSRGAIACGYLGLRDDTIADVWLAFWPHSHLDSGRFTQDGGRERLQRTRGRATLVTWGETDNAKTESPRGAALLEELGQRVTKFEIAATGHTDTWIEHDGPARQRARAWLAETFEKRPGTFTLSGRLVDRNGQPVIHAIVTCGDWHRAKVDASGEFIIRGLTKGTRPLRLLQGDTSTDIKPVTIHASDLHLGITPVAPRS
ncbi:MAG: hypothetical protein JNM18_22045 [Planctomycetaceae bacterium]|nr:hypothetical protein [Planctomycetaceae bacterium]